MTRSPFDSLLNQATREFQMRAASDYAKKVTIAGWIYDEGVWIAYTPIS